MSLPSPERVSATPELIERAKKLEEKLEERSKDLRAACEYVGNGVNGVIYAEVSENTQEAASLVSDLVQALEESQGKLARVREWAEVDDALGDTPSGYARKVAKRELRRILDDEGNPE